MGDENPVAPATPAPTNPNPEVTPGTDPKPTETTPGGNQSELSDEIFAKVFDDPRLYKHDRFKKLTEAQKELKTYKDQEAKRQEEELKKRGEFETLAEQAKKEALEYKTKFETTTIDSAIMNEAAKRGIQDLDAAKKLIDREGITLTEDGRVQGITEALDSLVKDRSYLLTINRSTVGSPTNPSDPIAPSQFKMSQIANPAFYREHKAEIDKAIANGQVIEDRRQ